MGYTHYWNNPSTIPEDTWSAICSAAKDACALGKVDLSDESGFPEGHPTFTADKISMCGVGEDGCEPFVFTRVGEWSFCKTRQLPYDKVVTAVLLIINHLESSVKLSSDGIAEEWEPGLRLAKRIFPQIKLPPNLDDGDKDEY